MMPSSNDGEHIPSNGGGNLHNGSHDTDIHDWMKSADGKFVSLENDSRSMKDKMETLQSTSERMEEFIKTHLPIINLAAATSNSLGGGPTTAAVLTGEPEAKDGVAVKKKKKKKKKSYQAQQMKKSRQRQLSTCQETPKTLLFNPLLTHNPHCPIIIALPLQKHHPFPSSPPRQPTPTIASLSDEVPKATS
mmetsp:Transcript_34989/g.57101  ORF Transcript_34989/g.57101 Transcript_34989/m.57101 type:complete len:191 (-) Transcript_34989:1463-2035(-)